MPGTSLQTRHGRRWWRHAKDDLTRWLEKNGRPEKKMGFHEGPLSPYQFALNLDELPFCTAQC